MSRTDSVKDNEEGDIWGAFMQRLKTYETPTSTNNDSVGISPDSHLRNCSASGSKVGEYQDEKGFSRGELSYINKLLNSKLIETKESDIEVLRSDPDHPLHSVKSFQEMNLKESLLRGIASMGFSKPSAIQEKALPSLIDDHPQNMIAQSQSGTGKTATFLLAMLSRIDPTQKTCQCLCMVPTRELAIQIAGVAREMSKYIEGVSVGQAISEERPLVHDDLVATHLIIGTPGTVFSWIRGTRYFRLDAKKLLVFVLDEADIMMEEDGFLNISLRVKDRLSPNCQILLFSATYDDHVIEFAREMIPNPVEIRVKRSQLTLNNIKQFYMCSPEWEIKYFQVSEIYGSFTVGQAIIFCATRLEARWLKSKMEKDGHKVALLTGELDVLERETVINNFRRASVRVLITTNLCARGLDIPQVNLVINWNMPVLRNSKADCETYLHRIGRSGRFGKEGLAINFITPDEMGLIDQIEQHFDVKIPLLTPQVLESM